MTGSDDHESNISLSDVSTNDENFSYHGGDEDNEAGHEYAPNPRSSSDKAKEEDFHPNGEPKDDHPGYNYNEDDSLILWLEGYQNWEEKDRLSDGWKAENVWAGGYGIIGHWRYYPTGEESDVPESSAKDIVIKQQPVVNGDDCTPGLRIEADFMEMVTRTGSRHFPQLYDKARRSMGTGSHSLDREFSEVHRIYMEYLEGGTLQQWLQAGNKSLDMTQAWSRFVCLAKAAAVLDCGKEMENEETDPEIHGPWEKRIILHCDIRPQNIFLGKDPGDVDDASQGDLEHTKYTRLVLGDFGIAMWVPRDWENEPAESRVKIIENRKPEILSNQRAPELHWDPDMDSILQGMTPELAWDEHHALHFQHVKVGSCTNVWQVGKVMWTMLLGTSDNDFYNSYSRATKLDFEKDGLAAFSEIPNDLAHLVHQCLHFDPKKRPSPQTLVEEAIKGLTSCNDQLGRAAARSRVQPIRSLLMQPDNPQPEMWDDVLPELRKYYLETDYPGFREWDEARLGGRPSEQASEQGTGTTAPKESSSSSESNDNDNDDDIVGSLGDLEIAIETKPAREQSAPTSEPPESHASHHEEQDRVGEDLEQSMPVPDASTEDVMPHLGETSHKRVSWAFLAGDRSIKVVVEPWCCGTDVMPDPYTAEIPLNKTLYETGTVELLHNLVLAHLEKRSSRGALTTDNFQKYTYYIRRDDQLKILKGKDKLSKLGDLPLSQDQIWVHMQLKSSLPRAEYVEDLRGVPECVVYIRGYLPFSRTLVFSDKEVPLREYGGIEKATLGDILSWLKRYFEGDRRLSEYSAEHVTIRLRDQSTKQCLYDGAGPNSAQLRNQLIGPYCISGEREGNRVIVRLDVWLPKKGMNASGIDAVNLPFLFFAHVVGDINGKPFRYNFTCRRGARVKHLERALRESLRVNGKSADGKINLRPSPPSPWGGGDGSLPDDLELRKLLFQDKFKVRINATYVPRVEVLFWPGHIASEDTFKEAFRQKFDGVQNSTIGELKVSIREWRKQVVEDMEDSVLDSSLRDLAHGWQRDGNDFKIHMTEPDSETTPWLDYGRPLEDSVPVSTVNSILNAFFWLPDSITPEHDPDHSYIFNEHEQLDEEDEFPLGSDERDRAKPRPRSGLQTWDQLNVNYSEPDRESDGVPHGRRAPSPTSREPRTSDRRSISPFRPPRQRSPGRPPSGGGVARQQPRQQASSASVRDDDWFSDSSQVRGEFSQIKVRCFRKRQAPRTFRTGKKHISVFKRFKQFKTVDDLKEDIIKARIYPPDVRAVQLRIRLPRRSQDVPDDESLDRTLSGGKRSLVCFGPDWDVEFPKGPASSEPKTPLAPRDKPKAPAADGQQNDAPKPVPLTADDPEEADKKDFSDDENEADKKKLKVRCIRRGYHPFTFRTNQYHEDISRDKNITHLTQNIINSGYFGPADTLLTQDLILRSHRDSGERIASNMKVARATDDGKGRLYCWLKHEAFPKRYTAPNRIAKKPSATKQHQHRSYKDAPRQSGDETTWFSDSDDGSDNDDEVKVRCFCAGKAARTWRTTTSAGENVKDLKLAILGGWDDFYSPTLEPKNLAVRDPETQEELAWNKKLKNALDGKKKFLSCRVKGEEMEIPDMPKDGKQSSLKPPKRKSDGTDDQGPPSKKTKTAAPPRRMTRAQAKKAKDEADAAAAAAADAAAAAAAAAPQGNPSTGNPPTGNSPAANPPTGNPPTGNSPAANPPSGNPPTGNSPAGNPPAGNPPKGNLPKGNPPKGRPPKKK